LDVERIPDAHDVVPQITQFRRVRLRVEVVLGFLRDAAQSAPGTALVVLLLIFGQLRDLLEGIGMVADGRVETSVFALKRGCVRVFHRIQERRLAIRR